MTPLLLSYSGCSTCKKAIAYLKSQGVSFSLRPIVEEPPTVAELKKWSALSSLPIQKWLNTSGQSYRAFGKEKISSATDATLMKWLSQDGKLVKRPVLVLPDFVLVGFSEERWAHIAPAA
jgi:arsenate reductase (glutaredoxin)